MINILKGATNSFTLRFNDNVVGTQSNYLFEFQSIQSGHIFYCIPEDTSTDKDRYNLFCIHEISGTTYSESLTSSIPKIEFGYGGSYEWKVYEVEDYSLTPSSIILDSGKMTFFDGEYSDFFFDLEEDDVYIFIPTFSDIYTFDTNETKEVNVFENKDI